MRYVIAALTLAALAACNREADDRVKADKVPPDQRFAAIMLEMEEQQKSYVPPQVCAPPPASGPTCYDDSCVIPMPRGGCVPPLEPGPEQAL